MHWARKECGIGIYLINVTVTSTVTTNGKKTVVVSIPRDSRSSETGYDVPSYCVASRYLLGERHQTLPNIHLFD